MTDESQKPNRNGSGLFDSARWYDLGVNWEARLGREVPVLCDVFGPPGKLGLLDAACGTGRHVASMADAGYRVTGLDMSADMLAATRTHMADHDVEAPLIQAAFADIPADVGPFDGVFCLGNSLAATGSAAEAERSVAALASVLAPGGRLFVQILNFEKLRVERPRARGPRVRTEDRIEYISTRVFSFCGDAVEVISVTHWRDPSGADPAAAGWRHHATAGSLYAISAAQITQWCESAGMKIDATYGSYAREPFDVGTSGDLIVLATRPTST